MHEVKPKSYTLQPEKYVQDFKNFLLVTNYQQISKDGRKKPPPPTNSRNFPYPEKSHSSDLAWLRQTFKNRKEMLLHHWWPKKECALPLT